MFSREEFVDALLRALENRQAHPYVKKWLGAWSECETPTPVGAMHNLLNITQPGYGSDSMPRFGTGDVRNYPCLEDGIGATAKKLMSGSFPTLLDALRNNQTEQISAMSQTIRSELDAWCSGTCAYIDKLATLVNTGTVQFAEVFPGRHWGEE